MITNQTHVYPNLQLFRKQKKIILQFPPYFPLSLPLSYPPPSNSQKKSRIPELQNSRISYLQNISASKL